MNNKTVKWRREKGNSLIVEQQGGILIRLFGLPFLGAGGYFLYQFIDGVLHRDLTIAGVIILPVMAVVFLAPAMMLIFGRKRTVVDAVSRQINEVRHYGFMKREIVTKVPKDANVQVRYEVRRTGRDTNHLFCPVELTTADKKNVTLAEYDGREDEEAMVFARAASMLLGVELLDQRDRSGKIIDEVGSEDAD